MDIARLRESNTTRKRSTSGGYKGGFSVINLAKIVKKIFATTSVYGYRGFCGAFNGNSTQLKTNGWSEVIIDVFSSVRYSGFNTPVRT